MSATERVIRFHTCPVCTKRWHCLAENPPSTKRGMGTTRPVVDCVYPVRLLCPQCARGGDDG